MDRSPSNAFQPRRVRPVVLLWLSRDYLRLSTADNDKVRFGPDVPKDVAYGVGRRAPEVLAVDADQLVAHAGTRQSLSDRAEMHCSLMGSSRPTNDALTAVTAQARSNIPEASVDGSGAVRAYR